MELIANNNVSLLDKKALIETGLDMAQHHLSEATADPSELLVNARKAIELLTAYSQGLKDATKEELYLNNNKLAVLGSEVSIQNTGDRLNYDADETYSLHKARLKDREALLKLAYNSDETIYDSDATEVPKVGVKVWCGETIKVKL